MGDVRADETERGVEAGVGPKGSPKGHQRDIPWVHPCRCSLAAGARPYICAIHEGTPSSILVQRVRGIQLNHRYSTYRVFMV